MNTICDTFQYVCFTYLPVSPFSVVSFEGLPVLWDSSCVLQWISWRLADGWSLIITTICSEEYVLCKSQSTFLRWEQGRWLVIERWSWEQRNKLTFTFHSEKKRKPLMLYYHILNLMHFISLTKKDFTHEFCFFFWAKQK